MTGKSHIAANVATMVLASDAYLLCSLDGAPGAFHAVADGMKGFVSDTGGLPLLAYVTLCPLMFLVGSVLPDADHPYSPVGKIVHVPVGHRTWLHAIYIPAILMLAGIRARWSFWLGLGYFLHLFWDSPSRSGVPWFYPHKGKHRVKLYSTGKPSEYVVVTLAWVVAIGLAALAVYLRTRG